jgi:hypothetical protein
MTSILDKTSSRADGIIGRSNLLPCQEATKTPPDSTKEKTMVAASAIADWRARHADSTTDEPTVSCLLEIK